MLGTALQLSDGMLPSLGPPWVSRSHQAPCSRKLPQYGACWTPRRPRQLQVWHRDPIELRMALPLHLHLHQAEGKQARR
jgi:hypothetical protein